MPTKKNGTRMVLQQQPIRASDQLQQQAGASEFQFGASRRPQMGGFASRAANDGVLHAKPAKPFSDAPRA